MNIKDKPASANTLTNTLTDGEVEYEVKIFRLQTYGREDRSSNVRITIYHPEYDFLFYELASPHQEIGGVAIFMGLLTAMLNRSSVKIKASRYHGTPHVGYISEATFTWE
ncbi:MULTISPECIES: hypothetical protein [Xenorhabdus]|uniref:hypothetical protein n=1 Tax=Xenorhabdus TaxID=626 RepID=UPI0006457455|nr:MULTISPECIES: hypothetical protein [Xenorhabdus]MBC8944226.1 hypothetical protein [Xenorhabdus indica]